jgi:hypothetical protein
MDGNGDGSSSHHHHPRFASLCVVVVTSVVAPIDGASIIVILWLSCNSNIFPLAFIAHACIVMVFLMITTQREK